MAAVDSDALVKTGAFDVLRKYNLFPQEPGMLTSYPAPGAWADGRIAFSAAVGDTTNLWQLPISEAFLVSGPPGRLTAGAGVEGNPSITSSEPGRKESPLFYSSLTEKTTFEPSRVILGFSSSSGVAVRLSSFPVRRSITQTSQFPSRFEL